MATPPVFLPGEFQGQRSLAGYGPWGCKELDITERLTDTHTEDMTSFVEHCCSLGSLTRKQVCLILDLTNYLRVPQEQVRNSSSPPSLTFPFNSFPILRGWADCLYSQRILPSQSKSLSMHHVFSYPLFIYGCARSSLLTGLSLVAAREASFQL